ncbi:MAG: ArnT family glycosyltransferase [Bacteriovoracaceae bacterium]
MNGVLKWAHYRYFIVAMLAMLLSLPFLSRGLYETSEGRYAKVAQNMVDSGDYFVPRLNGKAHLTKPPLTYWVIAMGLKSAGQNTQGARLPHAFVFILLALVLVKCGDLLASQELGLLAGTIFATSLFSSLGSMALTTDLLVTFFHALSFLAILLVREKKTIPRAMLFWVAVGLGFLTKGPVAFLVLPFFFLWMRDEAIYLFTSHTWPLGLMTGLSWYAGLELTSPGILRQMFYEEIYLRATTDFSGRNPFWWAPFAVYVPPILLGGGAWILAASKKSLNEMREVFPFHWSAMLLAWIMGLMLFFMLVKSRLPLYVLPLTVPVSLLLAWLVLHSRRNVMVPLAVNLLLLLTLKTYGTFFHQDLKDAGQLSGAIAKTVGVKTRVHTFKDQPILGLEFYRKENVVHVSGHTDLINTLHEGGRYFLLKKNKVRWFKQLLPQVYSAKRVEKFGPYQLVEIAVKVPTNPVGTIR